MRTDREDGYVSEEELPSDPDELKALINESTDRITAQTEILTPLLEKRAAEYARQQRLFARRRQLIVQCLNDQMLQADIAEKFGVSQPYVSNVLREERSRAERSAKD
jgi:predicted XRE-type DNA-binding protein